MNVPPNTQPLGMVTSGTVVVLRNLRRVELNGRFGNVVSLQGERLVVNVPLFGRMALRPQNLGVVPPVRGWCHNCGEEIQARYTNMGDLICRCGSNFVESSASQEYDSAADFLPSENPIRNETFNRSQPLLRFGMQFMLPFLLSEEDIINRLHEVDEPRGPPPAAASAVAALREQTLTEDSDMCTVCQDEQKCGDISTTMPCGHSFHRECVTPWLKEHNTCPTCRHELLTNDAEYNREKQLGSSEQQPLDMP